MATETASRLPAFRLPEAAAERLRGIRRSPLARRALFPTLVTTVAAMGLFSWAFLSSPERTPLYATLGDADKAEVVSALEKAGMKVAVDPRTGTVLLPADDHARARMLLASQGLPKAAPDDLLTDMPLGTSRALEGARLKTARERELARSIESLQGVEAARVIIAEPDESPFVRERAPVTASVTVRLAAGRTLSESQARAILHLVAGAVPGLSTDNVAIADQTGRLIAGEPGGAEEEAANRRLQMQARMEARAREAILMLLGPIVGPGNVSAQVAIDIDFAATEAARETYDRDGALRSEATKRSTSTQPRAIGIPGALSNTIPAAATVTAAPPPAQVPAETSNGEESATRNYELGRDVEVVSRSGGRVRRLTAAVAIDAEALGPAAGRAQVLKDMEALVQGAVGFDAGRGDRIAVAARSFAAPADTATPLWKEPVLVESSKWLSAALIAIAILAFLVRPMLKRVQADRQPLLPAPGETLLTPIPIGLETPDAAAIDYAEKLEQARRIASTDAARATAVARRLLAGPAEAQPERVKP